MWHSTLDLLAQEPGADLSLLARIRSWITDGVTLDLVSTPECIHHENTFSVTQEEDAVRLSPLLVYPYKRGEETSVVCQDSVLCSVREDAEFSGLESSAL